MKLKNLNLLVFVLALITAGSAQAGLPAMPEISVMLPDAVREPLIAKRQPLALRKLALIDEGKAINQQCAKVETGSSQHQACLARQAQFNASAEILRTEMDALADEIDAAIEAEKQRRAAPNTDTSVVDARVPSGLDKATENAIAKAYPNAPPGVNDRVRKGFQAVMERDWKVAKAWFEDALNRDPGNPGLQRLVALADYSQHNGKPFTDEDIPEDADPQTYAMTSTKIHSQRAWSKFLFPDGKNLRTALPVFKTLPDGRVLQLPSESDILFLFPGEPPAPSPRHRKRLQPSSSERTDN